jgi:hypothetical protein
MRIPYARVCRCFANGFRMVLLLAYGVVGGTNLGIIEWFLEGPQATVVGKLMIDGDSQLVMTILKFWRGPLG